LESGAGDGAAVLLARHGAPKRRGGVVCAPDGRRVGRAARVWARLGMGRGSMRPVRHHRRLLLRGGPPAPPAAAPAPAPGPSPPPSPAPAPPASVAPPDSAAVPVPLAAPASPAPSAGGHAIANPQLTAVRMVRLTGRPRTVLRTGPSDTDAIAAVFVPGTSF